LLQDPESSTDLKRLLANYDHQAAWAMLFRASHPHALRAARDLLDRRLRSAFDPADLAADVTLDLVRDFDRLEFPSFAPMIAYLRAQVERRVRDARHRRRHTA
jgi:hypothetical protein